MKIGYIHDTPMPSPEASTVNVSKMCDAFAANGHEVLLVTPWSRAGGDLSAHYGLRQPLKAMRVPRPNLPGGERFFSLAAALMFRAFGADVVYGRKPHMLLPAARLGLPVIYEAHAPLLEREGRARKALAALLKSDRLRRVAAISGALRDKLVSDWPLAAPVAIVAHDGADARSDGQAVLPRGSQSRPRIGYAGHLYPGKGMEMIFALAQRRPNVDFLVLGGKGEDLQRWREATATMSNVTLAGMVPHSQVPVHLASCDLVLAPYAREVIVSDGVTDVAPWMSPLKVFEYMAQGLTIVASDLPVLREILQDGVDAALCPPGDVEAWLHTVDDLLEDEARRKALGSAARAKLEAQFTWQERARLVLAGA
jgi:glycosyltransferase involved in cell wall biosynthesis